MNTWWHLIVCEGNTSEKTGIRNDEVMSRLSQGRDEDVLNIKVLRFARGVLRRRGRGCIIGIIQDGLKCAYRYAREYGRQLWVGG